MKIHHIGYLVRKIENAITRFEALGFQIAQDTMYDEYRKIHIAFMEKDGYCVELISAAANDSVVSGLYKQFRNAPYHLCYESDQFEMDLADLKTRGCVPLDNPAPAPALGQRRVVFLIDASIGMIELLEAT